MTDADLRGQLAGGPAWREPRPWTRPSQLICRDCGAVSDVAAGPWPARCAESARRTGFRVEAAEVTFRGRCARCQAAGGEAGPRGSAGSRVAQPLTGAAGG
jgi:hypothetical protein